MGILHWSPYAGVLNLVRRHDHIVSQLVFEPSSPTSPSMQSIDMHVRISEEVRDPAIQVPRAMLWTIVINTIAGTAFIIALSSVLPELKVLIELDQPLPYIIKSSVGSAGCSFALLMPMILLAVTCGIGCTTTTSRCIWAFARDGAIPGSYLWKKINQNLTVPLNAMLLSSAVQILVAIIYFGSATAFNSFYSSGVIFLTVSYTTPIFVSFFGGRKHLKYGRFYFKRFGTFCNVIAIGRALASHLTSSPATQIILTHSFVAWCSFAVPLFCMPSSLPVAAGSMNYASVVFVVFVLISAGWYWVWGYKNYHGPPIDDVTSVELSY